MVALGILSLVYSDFVFGLEPVPAGIPARMFLVYLSSAVLIAGGAGSLLNRAAPWPAVSLAVMLSLWVVALHLPALVPHLRDPNAWTVAGETLALCGAAWVLVGTLATQDADSRPAFRNATNIGRVLFGISLPVFGLQHFLYAAFVATLVPAWIPARLFWAYFVGAAFIAAGVSIVTKVQCRLAASLLGLMFAIWVLILHLPRVVSHLHMKQEWTSLVIALGMSGGAWLVAQSLAREGAEQPYQAR
jgi:uncharacterized membrane protein